MAQITRIRHTPTGITVCSENRQEAIRFLATQLKEREEEKRKVPAGPTSGASFGSQIRSYVLHPQKMVKDHRTDHETSDAEGVLDGEIEPFVSAFLASNREQR